MDRDQLQRWLEESLSLSAIGAIVDRHPSTMAYRVQKHGLTPNGSPKHAPRGRLRAHQLEPLIEADLSVRAMAARLGVSPSTVRYWLRKLDLETYPGQRRTYSIAQSNGANREPRAVLRCSRHGKVVFVRRPDSGYRCSKCAQEAVSKRRREVKRRLVAEAGGRCAVCGYDRYVGALEFHHLNPEAKKFGLSLRGITRSLAKLRAEASKCVLLCVNCHAEVEGGITRVGHRYSSTADNPIFGLSEPQHGPG